MPLLATKLYVPPVRRGLVSRPRLIERLNAGLGRDRGFARRLTLISAPAGFGKTTLVAEWLQHIKKADNAGWAVTWLSLDEGDGDPARFFAYLIAALQRVDPAIGRTAEAMLQSPQPSPPESLLTALINDVAAAPRPFILVLDDYHLITVLSIHQQLAFLLEHQPPHMHLVIATREDPPLPLSRLRARGQMVDVRQADLRFTEQEAADFLQRAGHLQLSPADVLTLHRRTEGWIAGLQLAALSLQGSDDVSQLVRSFSGSHRYILDYLIEEVFRQQPPDVQDFLLKTSILDRFTAPLCDVVCAVGTDVAARSDSRDILLALEQGNLFVIPLDESRRWYRYHRLFVDLLRQQLRTAGMQDLVSELHRRASRWYEAEGFPADAVHHALAASDWGRAAALILDVEEAMLKRGEVTTLFGWFRSLPDEEIRVRPQLCLSYSWALILTGQLEAAESYLGQAEEAARDAPALLGDIASAQAFIARARGDDRRTIELSQQALSLLPRDNLAGRSVVAVNLGIAHWSSSHLVEAERALTEASRAAQQSGNHYARLIALGFLGVVYAAQGRLRQAARLIRETIQSGGQSPATALAHNQLSALLYEWNDLEAAADHSQLGIELGRRGGNVEVQLGGYRTLARLKQAQGDAAAALEVLQEAHQLARESDVPPLERDRNAACHVRIALAQGDLAAATRWAEHVTHDADASPFYPLLGLTQARLLLAQDKKTEAAGQLAVWYETAARAGWQFGLVEVRVLQALAASTSDEALIFLAEALALADPEGFVRTFVDKGEPMAALLREAAARGIAPVYVAKLLAAFEGQAEGERRMPAPSRPALVPRPSSLVEPLTERELEVLQLLVEGQMYREIAQALCISINTVKTHLRNVYGKLGVHNRREAIVQAKELDLLP